MSKVVRKWITVLQKHADAWWYAPVIGLLAGLDAFVVVVPTDGLLVSAAMLAPRRWIYSTIVVTLGSTLGALALAYVVQKHGLPILLHFSPDILQSKVWAWTDGMMDEYGGWALFLIAVGPLMQQPAVALAGLSGMALWDIFLVVLIGRLIKYALIAWVSTHAPGFLGKFWGLQGELDDANVHPEINANKIK